MKSRCSPLFDYISSNDELLSQFKEAMLYPKRNEEMKEVTMNLNVRSLSNIEKLSEIIKEDTKTKVVSTSLEIARNILERVAKGDKVIIRSADNSEVELTFIL